MPWYYYEHSEKYPDSCHLSEIFEIERHMTDPPLEVCPSCSAPVNRVYTPPQIHAPLADSQLRNTGFAKLVRRDHGVYENVSAQDTENNIISFRPDGAK